MKKILLSILIATSILSCQNNKKQVSENDTVKPVEIDATGNANYDKIRNEYELFGKWRITNSVSNFNYPYEIYTKGAEYIGVIAEDEYKTEILEKKGDNYFVKESEFGEYYRIDSKMNMSLFDKDGELASMGYKATKE